MKIIKITPILTLAIATISCSPVKVVVDQEKNADFSGYTTYSFQGWQDVSDETFSAQDKKLMREAFISEFERRGLKPVNSKGDMQVSLYIVTSDETAFSGYTDYVGGRNVGYNHYGGGWGYGYSGNTYKQQSKLVGTLIMNVYDGKSNNQVWQAIATGTVTENPEKRDKTIPGKVAIIMKKFPVKPK
jgi:hypothetical protein